jgi:general secretion pathway protein E
VRRLILDRALAGEMRDAARHNGTRFLREQALALVRQGETTLEEINRVTFVA